MGEDASLRADCRRCAGLCCVALAFDRSAMFGHDKPSGTACTHLGPADRCGIHASRAERGYRGCVAYDCLGAGQLVTQQLFGGQSWRDCADGGRAMFTAFAAAQRVQQWRQLLASAVTLPLTPALVERRAQLVEELSPVQWSLSGLSELASGPMAAKIADFLFSLREVVPAPDVANHAVSSRNSCDVVRRDPT